MKNHIAKVISEAITINHKTQKQVAKDLNLATSTINSYCNGTRQPDLETLLRIQKNLNIPMEVIFNQDIDIDVFTISDYEKELLSSVKALNPRQRELFQQYTKDLLALLISSNK